MKSRFDNFQKQTHSMISKGCVAIITLPIILFAVFAYAEVSSPNSHQGERFLYQVKAGDTLRDLSRRFLGGEEFLIELLEYNKINNPLLVDEGFMLMIPGKERTEVIQKLLEARDMLLEAIDAKAEEFAADVFLAAQESITAAEENRRIGAYNKATALAQLGFARAKHAIELANARASIQQGGRITAIHGKVDISYDAEESWRSVSAGEEFTVQTIIRTGDDSRAELTLDDGSVIKVLESSKFLLHNFIYDLRDGKRRSELEVILGNILGKIKPRQVNESTFKVKSASAALAIRGTELRVGTSSTRTARVSVLDGEILARANNRELVIPKNFGTFAEEGLPPADPIILLPAPKIIAPVTTNYQTGIQIFNLSWEHVKTSPNRITQRVTNYLFNRFASYHIEIGTDTDFNQIVEDHITNENNLQTNVLAPGEYYWRISSIDNNGLEGLATPMKKFRVIRDLTVEIVPEILPIEKDDKWITTPLNVLNVIPAEPNSSIDRLEYSLNRGRFKTLDGKISLTKDGDYLLWVRGVGVDGYLGEIVQRSIQVDGTPPTITIDVSPVEDHPDLDEVVNITLDALDNSDIQLLEYKIDDGEFQPYTEEIVISLARKPGGVYLKGGTVLGKVFLDKHLRRSLKIEIHCHAIDIMGNESFERVTLKY